MRWKECIFFFSSRRRHTRYWRDWSSDVCSSDLGVAPLAALILAYAAAITSLGLALATWIPRAGRAAALTVGLYTVTSLGRSAARRVGKERSSRWTPYH